MGAWTVQHQSIYKCFLTGAGFLENDTITVELIGNVNRDVIDGSRSIALNGSFAGASLEFNVSDDL